MANANNDSNLAVRSTRSPEPVQQRRETVAPPVDVYENADELLLIADLPGARSDSIDIQLENGHLTIHAKRSDEGTGSPLAMEYRARDYFRSFSVPQGVDGSKIGAQFAGGVLHLHLPKSESLKPRRIEVKQG